MIHIRHMGVYVDDIEGMERFYSSVFDMIPVCSRELDSSSLLDDLYRSKNVLIETSKLITPYGQMSHQGDMVELVHVIEPDFMVKELEKRILNPIYRSGESHLAFGVDDMESIIERAEKVGGRKQTLIHKMKNGNLCAFITDPENNWIELIQRNVGYESFKE